MGALDCVSPNGGKISSSESTEVITIDLASTTSLDQKRDLESQKETNKSSLWWNVFIDVPIFILLTGLLILFELNIIPGHKSGFYCEDAALSFKFTGDTISAELLMTTIFVAPIVIMFITEFLMIDNKSYTSITNRLTLSTWSTAYLMRSYLYGMFLNLAIIEVMKGVAGMPRPTFFDICEPDTAKNCTPNAYVDTYTCTSTTYTLWLQRDAGHSFPSGHTSSSVFFALFISAYLQKRAFDWRSKSIASVPLVQLLVISFAAVSSLTRITDHRHHWWDVLVGTIVGGVLFLYATKALSNNFSSPKSKESEERPNAHRIFLR